MSLKSVQPALQFEYKEFLERPDPFGLSDELAASRTLLVEFRDAVEANSQEKVEEFCEGVKSAIAANVFDIVGHAMGIPEEDRREHKGLNKLARAMAGAMRQDIWYLYARVFGPASRITPEQARTMAALLKLVGDTAEKYKKMVEGASVRVIYDKEAIDMMTRFLSICVLPYCSTEQKAIIGDQALRFLPSAQMQVIDAEIRTATEA